MLLSNPATQTQVRVACTDVKKYAKEKETTSHIVEDIRQ